MLVRPPIGWFQLYIFAGLVTATIYTAMAGYQYLADSSFSSGYAALLGFHHLMMFGMFASALQSVAKRQSRSLTMMLIPTAITVATYIGILGWELVRGSSLPNIFSTYTANSLGQALIVCVPPALEIHLLKKYFANFDRLRTEAELSE